MGESSPMVETLLGSPYFKNCTRASLARLIPLAVIQELLPGEGLLEEGGAADGIYLILEGDFLIHGPCGRDQPRDHGILGEEAALGLGFYTASVRVVGAGRVLYLPRDILVDFVAANPEFHDAMQTLYSGRFRIDALRESIAEVEQGFCVKSLIGWLLAMLLPLLIYLGLDSSMGQEHPHRMYFLMIGSSTVVMWVFQLVPEFVPALFALLSVILLGLAPPKLVLSGFASNGFFIAMSIFGLSAVISASGLSYRTLLWLLRFGPANKIWYNLCLFIVGLGLTPVVPTTNGRVAIVGPFITDLLSTFGDKDSARERHRFAAMALGGVSLLSAVFLSSKSINFVVFGFLPLQEQERFQWLYWFESAMVVGGVMLLLFLPLVWLFYRNGDQPQLPKRVIREQLQVLGPMSPTEWAALLGLLVLGLSFATTAIHRIDVPWVALTILFWLLMFGFLDKRQFRERIDWSFLIFLGTLIGLVEAMRHLGVDLWLAQQVDFLGAAMAEDFPAFILLLAVALFITRLALPINATVVIFATLLLPYASAIGVNPWLVGFLILFFSESFVLPYQASYYLQFTSITGLGLPAMDRRIAGFHLTVSVLKLAAVYASLPFWRAMGIL